MGIMREQVYMTFGSKRYHATRARFSALIAETVKSALPDEFRLSSIKASYSSESQYVIITHENKIYSLRFSSHHRRQGVRFTGKNFYTFNFENFSAMKTAVYDFLLTSTNFMKLSANRYLTLSVIADFEKSQYTLHLDSLEVFPVFKRAIMALDSYELVTIHDGLIKLTYGGYSVLRSKKKIFPKYMIDPLEAAQQLQPNELMDAINMNRCVIPVPNKINTRDSEPISLNVLKATLGHKEYCWFIPKRLRGKLHIGDQVRVLTQNGSRTVTITDLITVDDEAKASMQPVVKLISPNNNTEILADRSNIET